VRGGGLRLALLRREPTTASSVSSSFKASPVSASSGVPVAVGRVDANALKLRSALRASERIVGRGADAGR
jgi:hypothetical protein